MRRRHDLYCAIMLMLCGMPGVCHGALSATELRCQRLHNPLGIDTITPHLSWIPADPEHGRGQAQTAYRILIASTSDKLAVDQGDLWDSGRVASDQTLNITYAGKTLRSGQPVWWKVMLWDHHGEPSSWSSPATWSMGLLQRSDWQAQWITDAVSAANEPARRVQRGIFHKAINPATGDAYPPQPSPVLRREFQIRDPIHRATIYATARGLYELRLNGRRVGDHQLAPGWTDYNIRVMYQSYDVTDLLRQGDNALGVTLGVGWYAGLLGPLNPLGRRLYGPSPQFLMQLEIEYADGSRQFIKTGSSWRGTQNGPIRMSEIYAGEDYDARLEMPGWDSPGFDDSTWPPAVSEPLDETILQAQNLQPIRKTRTMHPVSMRRIDDGVYQFDMGQNMVGWCRLTLRGVAGQQIVIRHFELLDDQGRGSDRTLFGARAAEHYICRGDPHGEICEPHFTYHGFRYVEVTGLEYEPSLDDLVAYVVRSDAPLTGHFKSSHEVANKLMHAAVWTQMGNLHSIPTDCPQRRERCGWMGDIQAFAPTAMYNMDMTAFFAKWLTDIRDSQFTNGAYTAISPYHFLGSYDTPIVLDPKSVYYGPFAAAPAWADAGTIIPWWQYVFYSDLPLLDAHFESARRWVDYIHRNNRDNLLFRNGRGEEYGDWLPAGPKLETDILATAFFARSTDCVARMATALGRPEQAKEYRELFERIRTVFQQTYIRPDGSMATRNPVAGIALALQFNLYPDELRSAAAHRMVAAIGGGILPTGIQTSHRAMLQLTQNGHHDEACRLMNLHVKPSWGYMIDRGATTIWENWKGSSSQNHFALGAVCEWLWRDIAGIAPDDNDVGFKHIRIAPRPGEGFSWARADYDSVRGRISTDWRVDAGVMTLHLTVPPNTTAAIRLPTADVDSVRESGRPVATSPDVRLTNRNLDAAYFAVSSGQYVFTCSVNSSDSR